MILKASAGAGVGDSAGTTSYLGLVLAGAWAQALAGELVRAEYPVDRHSGRGGGSGTREGFCEKVGCGQKRVCHFEDEIDETRRLRLSHGHHLRQYLRLDTSAGMLHCDVLTVVDVDEYRTRGSG
ncbi:hypothetical protein EDB89DRAFT_752024 [Lactarius sanguifluus]|nr:hypothetical protein EDB89DRAFT_752024 [Lactarius sanguifluus]